MPKSPETILLVDDEPSVLAIVETVLRRAGYCVIATSDPRHAIALSGNPDSHFDLLLTDVAMPVLDGVQLAQSLLRNSPRTKVLYMTGHPTRTAVDRGLPPLADLVSKPFRPKELVERVRHALALRASATAC